MCRIDEEVYFFIGNLPLFFQNKNPQDDNSNEGNQDCIQYHCPGSEPERLGNDNINASFFKHHPLVFVGDGTHTQYIFSRSEVGITDCTFIAGFAPLFVKFFQLP